MEQVRAPADAVVPAGAGGGGVPGRAVQPPVVPVRRAAVGVLPVPLAEPVGRVRALRPHAVRRGLRGGRRPRALGHAALGGPALHPVAAELSDAGAESSYGGEAEEAVGS